MSIAIQREYKMHVFHGTSLRNIRIEYNSYHVGNYMSHNMFRPGHRCGQMHHYTCTLLPATSKAAFGIGTTHHSTKPLMITGHTTWLFFAMVWPILHTKTLVHKVERIKESQQIPYRFTS
jgi:hypothetical protein